MTFTHSKRLGSYYEHEYIKRAITALHTEPLKIVLHLNGGNHPSTILEYINKRKKNLNQSLPNCSNKQNTRRP